MKVRHMKDKQKDLTENEKLQDQVNRLESRESQDARRNQENIKHNKR